MNPVNVPHLIVVALVVLAILVLEYRYQRGRR